MNEEKIVRQFKYEIDAYKHAGKMLIDLVVIIIYAMNEKEALSVAKKTVTRDIYTVTKVTEVVTRYTKIGDTENTFNVL